MAASELASLMRANAVGVPLDGWKKLYGCMYAWIDGPYTLQLYNHDWIIHWTVDSGQRIFGPMIDGHQNWEWAY